MNQAITKRNQRTAQRGATTVEYLVITGVVAVVAIGGFAKFGRRLDDKVEAQAEHVRTLEGDTCDGMGCACFVAGTPVATPSGERAIESLRPGDYVLAREEATGRLEYRPVVRTFITPSKPVIELSLTAFDGTEETLGVTAEHPFYIEGRGWTRAGTLEAGQLGVSASGTAIAMGTITQRSEITTVYNLEVEGYHTYFVGHTRAWVHNQYVNGRWVGAGPEPRPRPLPASGGITPLNGGGYINGRWAGMGPEPGSLQPPPQLPGNNPNNWLGGPDGVGGATQRPRIGTIRLAGNGGHWVLVAQSRPSYMPTNLVVPLPGSTLMASGTPLAPAVWAGQIAGTGVWAAEWYTYLTDGTVWQYVPPPRPHPVIQAR